MVARHAIEAKRVNYKALDRQCALLTSAYACGMVLLAPKICTTPPAISTGTEVRVEYTVFGTLTGTSYIHQNNLLPHVFQAGSKIPYLLTYIPTILSSFIAERRLGVFLTYVFRPTQREYS